MLVATLGAGALLVCASCLVLSPTHYDDTQLPANLRIVAPASFTRVPMTADTACNNSTGQWMAFVVDVSDGNPNDSLVARLFINGEWVGGDYPRSTGKLQRGTVRVCATKHDLQHKCNHVEMVVSSAFDESRNKYDTLDPNDFASVEWWVLPSADQDPYATAIDCSNLFDAGVP